MNKIFDYTILNEVEKLYLDEEEIDFKENNEIIPNSHCEYYEDMYFQCLEYNEMLNIVDTILTKKLAQYQYVELCEYPSLLIQIKHCPDKYKTIKKYIRTFAFVPGYITEFVCILNFFDMNDEYLIEVRDSMKKTIGVTNMRKDIHQSEEDTDKIINILNNYIRC